MAISSVGSHEYLDARFQVAPAGGDWEVILLTAIPDANGLNWTELTDGNGYAGIELNNGNIAPAFTSGSGFTAERWATKNEAIISWTASGGAFAAAVIGAGIKRKSTGSLMEWDSFTSRTILELETIRWDVGKLKIRAA